MRQIFLSILAISLLSTTVVLAEQSKYSCMPANGYVADKSTALKIAEAVLGSIYGKEKIDSEKPLKAKLDNDVWTVEGTLNCPEGQVIRGGVAVIEISKSDGKILRVSHGK